MGHYRTRTGMGLIMETFTYIPVKDVKNAEQAREIAKDWQSWQAEQTMYWSDVADWYEYFVALAKKFNLVLEFTEEGII